MKWPGLETVKTLTRLPEGCRFAKPAVSTDAPCAGLRPRSGPSFS